MIRTLLYNSASGNLAAGGEELLSRWQHEPGTLIWADFVDEQEAQEKRILEQNFGIHALAIQDAQRQRHPPKLEVFSDQTFLLFKELSPHADAFDFATIQLALFVGDRFLVTRHASTPPRNGRLSSDALSCAMRPSAR